MKTIAQQLKIKDFPFVIKDKAGNSIYFEDSNGRWEKTERNAHGKEIRYETFDSYWSKREYDAHDNCIRYENSTGRTIDYQRKHVVTLQQIADKMGINVTQLRIKD
jgi:hypothetical protein